MFHKNNSLYVKQNKKGRSPRQQASPAGHPREIIVTYYTMIVLV